MQSQLHVRITGLSIEAGGDRGNKVKTMKGYLQEEMGVGPLHGLLGHCLWTFCFSIPPLISPKSPPATDPPHHILSRRPPPITCMWVPPLTTLKPQSRWIDVSCIILPQFIALLLVGHTCHGMVYGLLEEPCTNRFVYKRVVAKTM